MTPGRRYLCWFFAGTALLLVAVGACNFAVDPYSVFGSPRLRHFNANKPDFVEYLRLTHAYAVEQRKPSCILLGTSRTGRGLDPASGALLGAHCYNMALPSISLYEMRRYFQHARTARLFLLAFDFRVFGTPTDMTGAFSEARLDLDPDGNPQFKLVSAKLPDLASTLLSLTALQSSLKTVRQQDWPTDTLRPDGFWVRLNEQYDHRRAFLAFTRDSLRRFEDMREEGRTFSNSYRELRTFLRIAYASQAEIRLLISPSHAWHWEALELAGLWPRFEEIKRNLVLINAEEAARSGRVPFPVWDFSGSYGPSLEEVPKSEGGRMRWYWETVHYKPELGELMLARMMQDIRPAEWPEFGVRLDPDNLEANLAALRDRQRAYATAHPEVIAVIRTLMKDAN